ncbi:MAG: hypothetical protein NW204_07700 [Xanthomonadaceae bacterium]|nr:hypothetical protein [Xanthomonadaceae bacterium]
MCTKFKSGGGGVAKNSGQLPYPHVFIAFIAGQKRVHERLGWLGQVVDKLQRCG